MVVVLAAGCSGGEGHGIRPINHYGETLPPRVRQLIDRPSPVDHPFEDRLPRGPAPLQPSPAVGDTPGAAAAAENGWTDRVLAFEPSADDRPYLGTGFVGARNVPASTGYAYGVGVRGVQPGQSLGRAGMENGDVLVELAGARLDQGPRAEAVQRLREVLMPLPADSMSSAVYVRGETVKRTPLLLGRQPPSFAQLETPLSWFETTRNDTKILDWIDRVTALDSGLPRYRDTLARHRKRFEKQDPFRLRKTVEVQLNPAAHENAAQELAASLFPDGMGAAVVAANGKVPLVTAFEKVVARDLDDELDRMELFLVEYAGRVRDALGWTPAARRFVEETLPLITERFAVEGEYMYDDEDVERERASRRAMQLLASVDRAAVASVAADVLAFIRQRQPEWRRLVAEHGGEGIVAYRETAVGRIEFAGPGRQTHKKRCALRFDLGGNDRYLDCGARADREVPISILVDEGGDDLYGATSPFAQAAAIGGVAVLYDLDGDDQYLARQWGQGAAVAGFALLRDWEGRDTYRATECAQGVAMCGAGVLIDADDDDTYTADRYAQGVGLPGGVGALSDMGGNDRYAATGKYGSEYGEDGVFSGWSQGVGFGFRHIGSGGVGLLHDWMGDDVYEAGNFSQGGGYFHAWGALVDDGDGQDRYIGSRYAQGFAAHQAAGTFLEGGGSDLYQSHAGVAQGLSWDETTVFFRDGNGDDTYETRGFSLASAAHNGIVVFIDNQGSDTYSDLPGKAKSNTYHGGHSFALFLDFGGDDRYGNRDVNEWNGRGTLRDDGAYTFDLPAHVPDDLSDLVPAAESDEK